MFDREDERSHADEMHDAPFQPFSLLTCLAQALQSVGPDNAAVAVHEHDNGMVRISEGRDGGADK